MKRQVEKRKRNLEKLEKREKRSRENWTKAYRAFMKAVDDLTEIKVHGTKKELAIKAKIKGWPEKTALLTKERDDIRLIIRGGQEHLTTIGTELTVLMERQTSDTSATDEVVTQVFALNEVVVRAAQDRETCLRRHVFPRLIDDKGRLLSQVTFDSADGLRRVVAMVNTMTIVQGDMAAHAMKQIQSFFDRFQQEVSMDATTKALYELTRQLLVEKTDFKVGPDLYRFLAMEIDADIFPELSEAQQLLRLSIRSEKTNSYIRLYSRKSRTDKWEVVPQS
ncbi:MAG: hypothetical protein AAB766_04040 [Patescibacteria group bacterium]